MKSLSLLHKLLLLCGVSIAMTVVLGAFATHKLTVVSAAAERIVEMNQVQRAQMDADMMHDGLRADVLLIHLASAQKSEKMYREGVDGVREHVARFRDDMKVVSADHEPTFQEAFKEVLPEVEH